MPLCFDIRGSWTDRSHARMSGAMFLPVVYENVLQHQSDQRCCSARNMPAELSRETNRTM